MPYLALLAIVLITVQFSLIYHYRWINFEKDFTKSVHQKDKTLFKGITFLTKPGSAFLLSNKHHTMVFEIDNLDTKQGLISIKWTAHYDGFVFSNESVSRTIIQQTS